MFDDDRTAARRAEADLEALSIEELEERVERLRRDIGTLEGVIARKRAQRAAADAVFGGRPT